MPVHDLAAVRAEAAAKLKDADFKVAVQNEIVRLKMRRTHFFPKRLKFQWPFRLEDHHVVLNRRRGDVGRTQ